MVGKRECRTKMTIRMGWDGIRAGEMMLGKQGCGETTVDAM